MSKRSFALALVAATVLPAQASILISSPSFTYSQSFDTLASSGANVAWVNDSTLLGWSLFRQPAPGTAITTYLADSGSGNSGSFISYGSSGSTDRALGGLGSSGSYFGSPASGNVAGWIAVAFTNSSSQALSSFTLKFDGEEWRNGGNTSAQTMVLEYGFGSSFTTVANWTAPGGSFNWASPVTGATAAAVNGNVAGKVSGLGGTITTANWTTGQTLWVRWVEKNDSGNDHGLAIDNLSLSVSAVPEPGIATLLLAGLAALGFVARRRV